MISGVNGKGQARKSQLSKCVVETERKKRTRETASGEGNIHEHIPARGESVSSHASNDFAGFLPAYSPSARNGFNAAVDLARDPPGYFLISVKDEH
jgi:hypothetical protein